MDEQIKDAFSRVRSDINSLNQEMSILREELNRTKEELINICNILLNLSKKSESGHQTPVLATPTQKFPNPTQISQNPTHISPLKALKDENKPFSSGNEGVPTDRQTDQQTDNPAQESGYLTPLFPVKSLNNPFENPEKTQKIPKNPIFPTFLPSDPKTQQIPSALTSSQISTSSQTSIDDAAKILDSLDGLKKEIRLKFKRLTSQEMAVFSTIYQMEEETGDTDYRSLAIRLGLTESSVRDYVGRIIGKGIPVDKNKVNNKTIKLSIPQNLKKIASLPTILQLRDL